MKTSEERRIVWRSMNILLIFLYSFLLLFVGFSMLLRCCCRKSSSMRKRRKSAFMFHIQILSLSVLSAVFLLSSNAVRVVSIDTIWKYALPLEFLGLLFFLNSNLRLSGFLSVMAILTFKKSGQATDRLIRKVWTVGYFGSVILINLVTIIALIVVAIVGISRYTYAMIFYLSFGIVNMGLSVSYIFTGGCLIRYFAKQTPHCANMGRLIMITIVSTGGFFFLSAANFVSALLQRSDSARDVGPYSYLVAYLVQISVVVLLTFFFGIIPSVFEKDRRFKPAGSNSIMRSNHMSSFGNVVSSTSESHFVDALVDDLESEYSSGDDPFVQESLFYVPEKPKLDPSINIDDDMRH